MLPSTATLIGFATQAAAAEAAQMLEIYRDFVKPGSEAAYAGIGEDAARICAEMKCPHPYIGIESLKSPKKLWFFRWIFFAGGKWRAADPEYWYGKSK